MMPFDTCSGTTVSRQSASPEKVFMERLTIDSCASNGRERFEHVRKFAGYNRL